MGRLVVVVFGLMGTGKTTLAQALGRELDWAVVHSDAVRKALAGITPTTRVPLDFGAGIYAEDFSARTYGEMRRQAREALAAGPGVILDGSYKREAERALVREMGREAGAEVLFIWCECSPEVARERLGIRRDDPEAISNGRVELFAAQARDFDPLTPEDRPLLRLQTGRELGEVLAELKSFVQSFWKKGDLECSRQK